MAIKIDLHVHSHCSDGRMSLEGIFDEAHRRRISVISITDHDSIEGQERAKVLADQHGIQYLTGLELNVSFTHPEYAPRKAVSLDFLAYQYNIHDNPLIRKLEELREYRRGRAEKILHKINEELVKEHKREFSHQDLDEIQNSVDGAFGRPHIAEYMVKNGIVTSRQEAFDRYLVKCNVPKMPLSLPEASQLVRRAGGKIMLAHPSHPRGTSLVTLAESLSDQQEIIERAMLPHIDGIECWHKGHDAVTTEAYLRFARRWGLMVSGGSDCHQSPVVMGEPPVPPEVVEQFGLHLPEK
ncbi:MAG: PHP domain-containing protein [Pseudomonadota bacterium]